MKELSIEQKAQRYDEAIDVARKINSGEGVAAPSGWTTCEVIFPELKESEDEKIRGAIIDHLKDNNLTEWATWLENQGSQILAKSAKTCKDEQKPAEWSEEDEEFLRRAIKATKEEYPVTANWLKSLKDRYTWKPNDKQIRALHYMNLTGNISYAGQGQVLIELYNDLKKLKGEEI